MRDQDLTKPLSQLGVIEQLPIFYCIIIWMVEDGIKCNVSKENNK